MMIFPIQVYAEKSPKAIKIEVVKDDDETIRNNTSLLINQQKRKELEEKARMEREAELQRAASMTQEDINISPKTADVNRMSMAYFAALTAIFGAFALRKSYAYEKK